tara:strand:- start:974 stop:2068 length:1095 start_codon:yes stop_codon:yes gene_type:complete
MPTTYSELETMDRDAEYDDPDLRESQLFDPRAMQEHFTATGAEGMLTEARAAFGISLDDKSEMDIYKVLIGPPVLGASGFFVPTTQWQFALSADQTSWATALDSEISGAEGWSAYAAAYAGSDDTDSLVQHYTDKLTERDGGFMREHAGVRYGDSPHMTDTYESYTGFIEDPDGYNVAQFASIMQYANLYNWQDTLLGDGEFGLGATSEIDDNVAMANNAVFLIQPYSADDSATITNNAAIMPEAESSAESTAFGLDMSAMDFEGTFLALPDSTDTTSLKQQLRAKWKCSEVVHTEMQAFLSKQTAAVASTITSTIDTKLTAKRQRSSVLEASALTALHAGSKTRPTSTYTSAGYDWMGGMLDD